ncbi:iron-siderophore ABC transporter substrate-binding protein [Gorillibacterium sp. CAU 1737]|uniref:ABC transporter substrate-binding protein n=1 Tax=Gorillibacterium sp. CAU 1737 TaxID=3140362 RepID=UPI003260B2EA
MLRSTKSLTIFTACILLALLIAGCSSNKQGSGSTSPSPTQAVAETSSSPTGEPGTAAADDTRVVKHALGEASIKGTPLRVVTLFQGATDAAVALGIKPVGAVESWLEQPFYQYLRSDLEGVTVVGEETQPNLEEINKLKPDLIIASAVRHEKIYEQLSQIAPTVVLPNVYQFKETTKMMGQALNKQAEADQLLANWDSRVADFKQKIVAKLGDKWPLKVSVLNFRADHARIYVTGYAGDILNELGFTRTDALQKEVDKGGIVLKLTDKESIPTMNADVSFYFLTDPGNEAGVQKTFEEWTAHPLWKTLDSVKNNQMFKVDEVIWNMGGGILAANKMLDQLYEHFEL